MTLSLSEADLNTITAQLFLFRDPNPLRLSTPVNTGSNLAASMPAVAAKPAFADLSFGVVDFPPGFLTPEIWLHRGDVPWRMASTGKLALLLAAVQLRDDVRHVKSTGLVSGAADYDELFATIWRRSSITWVKDVATKNGSPRISTIFDLSKTPIDFFGAKYDGAGAPEFKEDKLSTQKLHEHWSEEPDLTFWDRMWQVGTQSDNVAACTLGSEIGMAYVEAVQRAYGLFDLPAMRMLLVAAYGNPRKNTPVTRAPGAPIYRPVLNGHGQSITSEFDPKKVVRSTQGANVAALVAYLIALMQDKLVSSIAADAEAACTLLRSCLADEREAPLNSDGDRITTTSLIVQGVQRVATVSKAHTKLGIGRTKEDNGIRCEFAYIEASGKRYGVVAMGILPTTIGSSKLDVKERGRALGEAIHGALPP